MKACIEVISKSVKVTGHNKLYENAKLVGYETHKEGETHN